MQYRMHPDIRSFPSAAFYQNRLQDACALSRKSCETQSAMSLHQTLPCTLLSVQYRMHPDIRSFPSAVFYQNRLQDA